MNTRAYHTFGNADDSKKRKRHDLDDSSSSMSSHLHPSAPSSMFLNPPPAPSRKPSQRLQRPPNELDDFLSSDLELSFASTMSLNSPPGSPPHGSNAPFAEASPMAMDISPAPVSYHNKLSFDEAVSGGKVHSRPRAFTVARTFGHDLSNHATPSTNTSHLSSLKGSSGKRLQRSALPTEWMSTFAQGKEPSPRPLFQSADSSDAMDIDTDHVHSMISGQHAIESPSSPGPVPISAAPTITGFANLFFDDMSPEPAPKRPLKRRSLSPEGSPRHGGAYRQRHSNEGESIHISEQSSSPAPPSSPSARKFERFASTGGGLFRKASRPQLAGLASKSSNSNKRLRRPTISALVQHDGPVQSAYPVMDSKKEEIDSPSALPPPRRAFSAMIAPAPGYPSSDDNNSSAEFSSPAAQAYAKRQSMRTIRRRDGTDDFRPLTGSSGLRQHDMNAAQSPLRKALLSSNSESPSSRWLTGAGLPGFGDNEMHGKILPCERVSEDGLMRIDVDTLDDLINGKYNAEIATFQVIDCRFDYEFQGGHIRGAININTTAEIEEYLLNEGARKPTPSCSGDAMKKTILVFHCEFSAKRAPTFAKHLRSKDRAMNNHVYPRIHYPEVYILKGGYCQYFKESAMNCEPQGYVRMDDPHFARDCREDLDQFRNKTRFGRTRSYAYGESARAPPSSSSQHSQNHRNSAPTGTGGASSLFAAATAARTRRSGTISEGTMLGLSTLNEDTIANTTSSDDGLLNGVDGSPCPPPTAKVTAPGTIVMAMLKAKRNSAGSGRGPLQRAQTFAQIR